MSRAKSRRILSYPDLKPKGVRWSRQWIDKQIAAGKFPKSVYLGESTRGWVEDEIDDWIDARIAA